MILPISKEHNSIGHTRKLDTLKAQINVGYHNKKSVNDLL